MRRQKLKYSLISGARIGVLLLVLGFSVFGQGKNPVILIPGLIGSELRHKDTGEKVWFRAFKARSEDLRLGIAPDPTRNSDALVPGDVLRKIKIGILPSIDVYDGFIKAMEARGGYHEEKWETPSEYGYQDSLYLFPYDWRLDNVGNARVLVQRVEDLKRRLNKPDLKFDIVAHSMGGLISRYAVMYGDADLPAGDEKPVPTWAGARNFDKIILVGTPNEGSALTLNALINGITIGGIHFDLPFVQDTSKFTVFTIPACYQLLPAPGTFKAFDDTLEPVDVDIYDTKVWSKYGWSAINDKKFTSKFTTAEQKIATEYFGAALERAKRFHEALAAASGRTGGVDFYVLGSDCKTALDRVLIYRDRTNDKWKTVFRPKGFTRWDGLKITAGALRKLMISPGDGIVTRRSLEAFTESEKAGVPSIIGSRAGQLTCEEHNKLAANARTQDDIIGILNGKGAISTPVTENKEQIRRL